MINAYWWRGKEDSKNFGDELSSIILQEYFKVKHVRSDFKKADIISIGSVLGNIVGESYLKRNSRTRHVIGAGLISPHLEYKSFIKKKFPNKRTFSKSIKVHLVRGYLTQQVLSSLGEPEYEVGDPGLLLPKIYNSEVIAKYKVGIIPHVSKIEEPEWEEYSNSNPGVRVIDFRTDDFKRIVTEIKSCKYIISQSLHGLIIADAFSIPNVWFYNGSLHAGGKFKFYDYFSTVNREFDNYISELSQGSEEKIEKICFISSPKKIELMQDKILKAYSDALNILT